MASTSYTITVETASAQRSINQLNQSFTELQRTTGLLSTALGAVFSSALAAQFIETADAATNLQNRLAMIAQDGQTGAEVFALMTKTALSLGAPLQDVGNLFFRIANNTKDLGLKQTEQLRITELLNKAFQTNGLSVAEASSAVTQFGQALGRGVLQGDELNSILENAPPIAQAIADKFGVTTGALRELGSQGKITSRDIIDAMMAAGDSIDRDFAARIPTIANAWENFKTTLEAVTTQFDKQTGASKIIAFAITELAIGVVKLSKFMQEWGGVIANVVGVLVSIFAPIKLFGSLFGFLEKALIAAAGSFAHISNVAGTFGSIINKVKVYVIGFLAEVFPGLNKFYSLIAATLASIAGYLGLSEVFDKIGEALGRASTNADVFAAQQEELNKLLGVDNVQASEQARAASDALTTADLANTNARIKILGELTQAYDDFNKSFAAQTQMIGLGEEAKNVLQGQLEITQKYQDAVTKIREEMAKTGSTGTDAEVQAISDLTHEYNKQQEEVRKLAKERESATRANNLNVYSIKERLGFESELRDLQSEIAKTTMTDVQKKYEDIDRAARKSAESAIAAEEARRGTALSADEQRQYYDAAAQGAEQLKQKTLELEEAKQRMIAANNLEKFTLDALATSQRQLADIQNDIAKVFLPEIEKKYKDIDNAAIRSAENAIKAEEIRRKSKLSPDEAKAYYDAALAGTEALKQKTLELAAAEAQLRMNKAFAAEDLTQTKELQKIYDDMAKVTMNDLEKKEYDIKRAAEERADAMIKAEEAARGTKLSAEEEAQYRAKATEETGKMIEATRELDKVSRDWSTGMIQGIKEYVREATNGAQKARDVFAKAMKGMEDLIVDFVKTGKFEWKDFVNMMLEELLRMQIQRVFASILDSMMGSMQTTRPQQIGYGGGGNNGGFSIFDIFGGMFAGGFANGGLIPAGQFGIVGERGPEFISGPAQVTPMGSSYVTYNINAVDALSFKQLVARDPGFIHSVSMQGSRAMAYRR